MHSKIKNIEVFAGFKDEKISFEVPDVSKLSSIHFHYQDRFLFHIENKIKNDSMFVFIF